jgi:hypothetical protein
VRAAPLPSRRLPADRPLGKTVGRVYTEPAVTRALRADRFLGAAALTSAALGAAISFAPPQLIAVAFAVPVVIGLLILLDFPLVLLGAFVFLQIFEEYQYKSSAGSITLGLVALVLLFARSQFRDRLAKSGALRVGFGLLVVWMATALLRVTYEPLGSAVRDTIKAASYLAVVAIAAGFAERSGAVRAAAIGASVGLVILGVLGVSASEGVIPYLARRHGGSRELFGMTMPFERNYGLTVGYDSVALLAPIAVAYCAVHIGRPRPAIALLTLAFLVATVFQARGLVLQVVIAVAAIPVLRRPWHGWALVPVFAAVAFAMAGYVSNVDEISSQGRTVVQDRIFADLRANPDSFLTGRDQFEYAADALGQAGLTEAFANWATFPIHNLFLSELVAGGWLACLALIAAYLTMLIVAFQRWRADPSDLISQTLLLAALLVTFESLIEPVLANIAGLWLVFGFVLGRGLPSRAPWRSVQVPMSPETTR